MTDVKIALGPNGGFELTMPSTLEGRFHTVFVPGDASGISIIRKVLTARQAEVRREIGFAASPTQSMVEVWLRKDRQERMAAKAAKAEAKETKRAEAAKAVIGDINLGELDI